MLHEIALESESLFIISVFVLFCNFLLFSYILVYHFVIVIISSGFSDRVTGGGGLQETLIFLRRLLAAIFLVAPSQRRSTSSAHYGVRSSVCLAGLVGREQLQKNAIFQSCIRFQNSKTKMYLRTF